MIDRSWENVTETNSLAQTRKRKCDHDQIRNVIVPLRRLHPPFSSLATFPLLSTFVPQVKSVEKTSDGKSVVAHLLSGKRVRGDALLYAMGRLGNTDSLHLQVRTGMTESVTHDRRFESTRRGCPQ